MNVELGILDDGNVILVSDRPLRGVVSHVEYYTDQRLVMLAYEDKTLESELMHYEIPQDIAYHVQKAPVVLIYSLFPDKEPSGYAVPLTRVGEKIIA